MGHLPEYLMAPTQLWNLEVPALAVARHFARTLATLGGGNYNMGGRVKGRWAGMGASDLLRLLSVDLWASKSWET